MSSGLRTQKEDSDWKVGSRGLKFLGRCGAKITLGTNVAVTVSEPGMCAENKTL